LPHAASSAIFCSELEGVARSHTRRRLPTKARGKTRRLIQAIIQRIVEGYDPERIILFGSYAYGRPRPDSDLDLLVIKDDPQGFYQRGVRVHTLLWPFARDIPIEVLPLTPAEVNARLDIGDHFIEDLLTKGEVVYAREAI
jgi:predicted nucleotidyltransferase